jgi:hypothetical protein
MKVGALKVGHGLKALLLYGVLLILNREKHDRQSVGAVRWSSHKEVRARCVILSMLMSGSLPMTDPDHGSVGLKGRSERAVVAKTDKCVVWHSREPWAVLAHGTQSPILGEVEVGVIVQLYLKRRHKNVINPISIAQKVNTEICIKASNSK